MSGSFSRNKGQRGEREVIKLLQPVVTKVYQRHGLTPPVLERNQNQSNLGGSDMVGLAWLSLEVKYHEVLQIASWWNQAKKQAEGREPILIYRRSRLRWRVVMYGHLPVGERAIRTPVDITVDAFLVYFEHRIAAELKE